MTRARELGVLAAVARILVRADVVPGPAVEAPVDDVRDVVGHQIVAETRRARSPRPTAPVRGDTAMPTALRMPDA
jgi:hypothetical protein